MVMEMSMGAMILAVGMPSLTILFVILTMFIKGMFKERIMVMWGLIVSLGLFSLAMILEHTGMVSGMFLMWAHVVLPIGMLLIYLGLRE